MNATESAEMILARLMPKGRAAELALAKLIGSLAIEALMADDKTADRLHRGIAQALADTGTQSPKKHAKTNASNGPNAGTNTPTRSAAGKRC